MCFFRFFQFIYFLGGGEEYFSFVFFCFFGGVQFIYFGGYFLLVFFLFIYWRESFACFMGFGFSIHSFHRVLTNWNRTPLQKKHQKTIYVLHSLIGHRVSVQSFRRLIYCFIVLFINFFWNLIFFFFSVDHWNEMGVNLWVKLISGSLLAIRQTAGQHRTRLVQRFRSNRR